jgi:hypothetical protein
LLCYSRHHIFGAPELGIADTFSKRLLKD